MVRKVLESFDLLLTIRECVLNYSCKNADEGCYHLCLPIVVQRSSRHSYHYEPSRILSDFKQIL